MALWQGHYFTSFQVPDVYGVYKFMVTYQKQGYTALGLTQTVPTRRILTTVAQCPTFLLVAEHSPFRLQVSVRPFRHNEFQRFLPAAYPYYASVFFTMAAFFLFGCVFLHHK